MRLPIVELSSRPSAITETGPRSIGAVRVLRISITDRCNYRCLYCMPEDGIDWLPQQQILSFEEIATVVRAAVEIHGIRRFKLTGGEPTVRHGLPDLVRLLRKIKGVEDLSLTTNGQRLSELAEPLRQAGLDRLTISIDSLNEQKFRKITRTGDLSKVLKGLDAAERAGFESIKINCVTMRGTNDDELAEFAKLTLNRRLTVRFIEYMPLGEAALLDDASLPGDGVLLRDGVLSRDGVLLRDEDVLREAASLVDKVSPEHPPVAATSVVADSRDGSGGSELFGTRAIHAGPAAGCDSQDRGRNALIDEQTVRQIIEDALGPLQPVDRATEPGVGPANVYRLAIGNPKGRLGFISAMSAPFCATCNRLRLTPDGLLRSCLFDGGEVDVKPILRAGSREKLLENIARAITDCVRLKPETHSARGNQQMSRIGG